MGKFKRIDTEIGGLYIIEPTVFNDNRGFFMECYSKRDFEDIGIKVNFVQDNHSRSKKGVLRGLHFQSKYSQGKLVRVTKGAVLDVVVDLRKESLTFGKYYSVELTENNKKMFFIPRGFAHGFLTLKDNTEFQYKCTEYYTPEYDSGIIWNDEDINIKWDFEKYGFCEKDILLSDKDKKLQTFKEFIKSGVIIE